MKAGATVVLGDDHAVFLDALATVLTDHGHSVHEVACSTAEFVDSVRRRQADLCLINRCFEVGDSTEVISSVVAASARTRVIMLSSDPDSASALRALDAGAAGYLHKSRGVGALISAVERTLRGHVVIDIPPAADIRSPAPGNDAERVAARLTNRERECLALLVEGLDTLAMVAKLGVSRTTVRSHVQAVLHKLGVHSRLEAASLAVRSGLLNVGDDSPLRNRCRNIPAVSELSSGRPGHVMVSGSRWMDAKSAGGQVTPFVTVGRPLSLSRAARPPAAPVQAGDRPA
jgi:two-component system, NarL family, nitrate/nitrite response regulator NarL